MDRKLSYPGQIPLSAELLRSERNTMVGLAQAIEAVMGPTTVVAGLDCVPTLPTSLTVVVLAGSIMSVQNLDGSAFGSLPSDTARSIVKQGINLDPVSFALTPPATNGHAINYLIQAQLAEADGDNLVLPYVNSSNPSVPWSGPNNSGVSQPTTRKTTVALSAKAGTSATAGSQTTPSPDAGYVGLYSVTVAYGATTLDTSVIRQLETAPFLYKTLPELPDWIQSGEFLWGDDTGTANAMVVANVKPLPTAYTKGMHLFVRKMNAANSGNLTVNVTGEAGALGAVAVLDATGAQIASGNAAANFVMHLVYDGTAFRWINGSISNVSISSITATSGEGITVGGSTPYPVSLNFPGLTPAPNNLSPLDLFAFYDNEAAYHRAISWADLLAKIIPLVTPTLASIAPLSRFEMRRNGSDNPANLTNGSWIKRTLNTNVANQIPGCSISNSVITLPAGRYRAEISGASNGSTMNTIRLQDTTNNVTLMRGSDQDNAAGANDLTSTSWGSGYFIVTGSVQVELQHITYGGSTGKQGDETNTGGTYHLDAHVQLIREGDA